VVWYGGRVETEDVEDEAGVAFRVTCVVLMSRRFFSKIFAISIVIPQKSGTRCEHVWWQESEHSGRQASGADFETAFQLT
jgi:hypothetical protein